jgi:hypothetical protein
MYVTKGSLDLDNLLLIMNEAAHPIENLALEPNVMKSNQRKAMIYFTKALANQDQQRQLTRVYPVPQ